VGHRLDAAAWRVLWGRAERAPVAFPPGHFYSPLPGLRDIAEHASFDITEIDLRRDQQSTLLAELALQPPPGPRWQEDNAFFPALDASTYQAIVRRFRPSSVVEVGSGWSTAALFDVGAPSNVTLIEPYPDRLRRVLTAADLDGCNVLQLRAQDVPLSVFQRLQANDVLFIDSTHVVKLGSDVNRIFFEILPTLAAGVIVHFHDVQYPFEYPDDWARSGRGWNEAYLLRAFLQYTDAFQIMLWPHMLQSTGDLEQGATGSIWLRRV